MRKTQKKEAEDLIGVLSRAHGAVKKAIKSDKNDIAMDILVQCQDGAIKLGDLLENAEGEDCPIISMLEEYCEIIYQIYENVRLTQGRGSGTKRLLENLNRILLQIKHGVEEMKARTEAVFLPYNASMWDSLESVWKAAEEDPDCDAYVIPIPYYDKNPDGSFREVHYEGDLFPDYVPITNYNDYNFEDRRPDIIFIHNPYDDYNFVTSVHPFFYSKNLKQYTAKLVYIPYYVLAEPDPENEKTIEGIQHFCKVPGVFYADKVVVQSEAMRQVYIKVLTKETGEESRKIWEEKILGLGSPKMDKVADTRREDVEVPEEWLKIIEKPDGSRKKIILYNNSVTALLKHEDKMLKKMEYVFRTFKENQEDVALLWRPHPLIKATIESMRPELWEKYRKVVEQYREDGWGIYDDTPDMDRAVAISDGYYGDASSIVQLCQEAGKPVMIQNVDMADNDLILLTDKPYGFILTDERICWYNRNSVILQERKNGRQDSYKWINTGESITACEADGKIYFAPMAGEKIGVLNLQTLEMKCKDLPEDKYIKVYNKFYQTRKYCNSIYFLPGKYPYILEYVLNEKKIKRYDLNLEKIGTRIDDVVFCESSYVYDEKIFLAAAYRGVICSFDMKDNQIKYNQIIGNDGFTTICGCENVLYLTDKNGDIFKVLIENDIKECKKIFDNKRSQIRKSVGWNNKILMFMEETEECIIINSANDSCEIAVLSNDNERQYNGNKYGSPQIFDGKLYIFNNIKNTIIVIDDKMVVEEYQMKERMDDVELIFDERTIIYENNVAEYNTMSFYLSLMKCLPNRKNLTSSRGNIGKRIKKIIENG